MKGELARYREAIEWSKDIIFWADEFGTILHHNKAFEKFFNKKKINIKNIDRCFSENNSWKEFFLSLSTNPILYETVYKDSNGISIPVEFYASKSSSSGKSLAFIVAKEIVERKKFEFKIKQVTEELIRSNKDLQEFAYIASHDLKEPLRKISMFSDKLQRRNRNLDEDSIFYLNKIINASMRMQDMIDSILEYSRVGTTGEDFASYNAYVIIKTALENCETSLEECGGRVSFENDLNINIFVDKNQIMQVFQNLISNSIKFRKKEEILHIKIGCINKGKRVIFYVEDNGIGIKEGFNEKVFLPFTKLHSKSLFSGHGMGLSVCKKIIERHGGKIVAQSIENEWTKIQFDLQSCES